MLMMIYVSFLAHSRAFAVPKIELLKSRIVQKYTAHRQEKIAAGNIISICTPVLEESPASFHQMIGSSNSVMIPPKTT